MRKIILSFAIFLSIGNLIAQENCMESTNGKFTPSMGTYKNNYSIIRNDSIQIDIDKVFNTKTEYKIIWIDTCSYKLKRISGKKSAGYKNYDLNYMTFKIHKTFENGYQYLLIEDKTNYLMDTTTLESEE